MQIIRGRDLGARRSRLAWIMGCGSIAPKQVTGRIDHAPEQRLSGG
jgi:hypothetical protein